MSGLLCRCLQPPQECQLLLGCSLSLPMLPVDRRRQAGAPLEADPEVGVGEPEIHSGGKRTALGETRKSTHCSASRRCGPRAPPTAGACVKPRLGPSHLGEGVGASQGLRGASIFPALLAHLAEIQGASPRPRSVVPALEPGMGTGR